MYHLDTRTLLDTYCDSTQILVPEKCAGRVLSFRYRSDIKTMTGASLLESMSLCILRECILPVSLRKCQKLIIEIEFYISAFATGCIRKEAFYGKWT